MELSGLGLRADATGARLACDLRSGERRENLWFDFPGDVADGISADRYDGLVLAMLPRAMARGEDIVVRGAVSARLDFNLRHFVMPVLAPLSRQFRPVRVVAEAIADDEGSRPAGVATGFSAGVDSFAVLHDHFVREERPGYRITHLLFNNVGSHGQRDPVAAERLFRQRLERIRGYPEAAGLRLVPVNSNLDGLLGLDFELTHTLRNVAVALLLQRLLGRFYYASTYTYAEVRMREHFDSGCLDPLLLPLLSTGTLDLVAAGSQHTRVEKTRLLVDVPGANRYLNVCTSVAAAGSNCSKCKKCSRTQLTLESFGVLDQFDAVFDRATWEKARGAFIAKHILNPFEKGRLSHELRAHLQASGYRFTAGQRVGALANFLPKPVANLLRSVRRRAVGLK